MCVEVLLQAPRGPGFQIGTDLLRPRIPGGDDGVDVIRAAVDRMKVPAAVLAGLGDLSFDGDSLLFAQTTRILGHSRGSFYLEHGVGKLPTMLVLHPPPGIARQPRAVGHPRQEEGDRIVHLGRGLHGTPTRKRGRRALAVGTRSHWKAMARGALAYASGFDGVGWWLLGRSSLAYAFGLRL